MDTLENQRRVASEKSQGISTLAIYSIFIRQVIDLKLCGDILDFGAGKGNLTKQLMRLKQFNSISAVDLFPRPDSLDSNIHWVSRDLNEVTDFSDQSFDVLVSAEVIEHLENPRAVVREWFRLLRPQGVLLFSTPNNESWRSLLSLLFQGHFVAFRDTSYPAHITALLRKDIERILQEAGFLLPEFKFTDSGGIPKLPSMSWQSVSGNLLRGLRYSDNLMVLAKKPKKL